MRILVITITCSTAPARMIQCLNTTHAENVVGGYEVIIWEDLEALCVISLSPSLAYGHNLYVHWYSGELFCLYS